MGLHEISRELQLRVCNNGPPYPSSLRAREAELFYRGGKEVGKKKDTVNKEFMAFHWLNSCQERRGVFLLPVGLCYHPKV